ncbi:MAG TPA: ROK family protein [Vicinamibacteria bacterium]
MSDSPHLGIDLGGTQLRMAAVGGDGSLLTPMLATPTGRDFGPDDLRAGVAELLARVKMQLGSASLAGVGLGTTGVVRPGPLSQCSNLPRLNGLDLAERLRAWTALPAAVENDARCFTLAEALYGAARGARHVVGITLGTGVGCGVMIDGHLHQGAFHEAGEVWDIPVRETEIEEFLSGAGLVRAFRAAGGDAAQPSAADLAERARAGDPAARAAWDAFGGDLAFLCHCIGRVIDPEAIVLGGSMAQARDLFDARLREKGKAVQARIRYSTLGPAAGVIGAASLTRLP